MNPQLLYLRDVLGVESWLSPDPSPATETRPPNLTIILKDGWTSDERSLAEKILVAVAVPGSAQAIPDNLATVHSPHLLIFDSSEPVGRYDRGSQTHWCLGPLRSLLAGPADQIQANKRDVWNLLKRLKEELVK